MLNPDISEFLERFSSTQFGYSQTNYQRCDCLGLVILYLKHTNRMVLWEDRCPRGRIKYQGLQELVWSLPFEKASNEQIKAEVTTMLWCPQTNGYAHIGLRMPLTDKDDESLGSSVYHISPRGLVHEKLPLEKGISATYVG